MTEPVALPNRSAVTIVSSTALPITPFNETQFRRYLLGELAEAEQTALEDAFLTDPQLFTRLAEAENDLIDAYVRGRLDGATRARFERAYLRHPDRKRRVALAQALLPQLEQMANDTSPALEQAHTGKFPWLTAWRAPRLVFSAALATLLIAAGVWGWREIAALRSEVAALRAARIANEQRARTQDEQLTAQRQREEQLTAELARLRATSEASTSPATPSSMPGLVTLLLDTLRQRGAAGDEKPRVRLRPDTPQVQIILKLGASNYRSYSATLTTATDALVWNWTNIKPTLRRNARIFTLILPAARLTPGEYTLALNGIDADGEATPLKQQSFRVERP